MMTLSKSLPAWTYTSNEFFELEKNSLFLCNWQLICHTSNIPNIGDYFTLNIFHERILVIKGNDNVIRAFHNVCSHRATKLIDKYGPRIIIKSCLISLISICTFILFTNNKIFFWILGMGIGFFIGGLQSTSRSCMSRLSKINDQSKMFGIYGLSGKITAFLGPYFVALLTTTFNNQKAGFVSIIIFFILGYLIIKDLKLPN